MKVKDYKGKEIKWIVKGKRRESASNLHKKARDLIATQYPYEIHEEVKLPGSKPPLYFDFVLPHLNVCVEVQGTQHWKLSSLYHQNILDLKKQIRRDTKKAEWCEANGLRLVLLFDGEKEETWLQKVFNLDDAE